MQRKQKDDRKCTREVQLIHLKLLSSVWNGQMLRHRKDGAAGDGDREIQAISLDSE